MSNGVCALCHCRVRLTRYPLNNIEAICWERTSPVFKKLFKTKAFTKRNAKILGGASAVVGLGAVAAYDMLQKQQSVLRNYPVIGHARSAALLIRPELQQYFIERDWDGRPFDRTSRELIYARSKDAKGEESFGTIHDVTAEGKEWFVHSITPVSPPEKPP